MARRVLFISSLALALAASAQGPEDPVLRARAQRATAQGISEGDLPAVPRGIIEPPPLPPPEAHVKDTRKAQKGKAKGRKGKAGATTKGKKHTAKPKSAAKTPAKGKAK
jgi:hypothetical protein